MVVNRMIQWQGMLITQQVTQAENQGVVATAAVQKGDEFIGIIIILDHDIIFEQRHIDFPTLFLTKMWIKLRF